MRISADAHRARPWRIHDMLSDFKLEDVWALPTVGRRDDFPRLVEMITEFDPASAESVPTRILWTARDRIGKWLRLGRISAPVSSPEVSRSLGAKLPDDLRGSASGHSFPHLPLVSLYLTEDEFAAEMSNATVHGVMHLGWVDAGDDSYRAEMSVYVKPRGGFGRAYMAAIKPFRAVIVYPALERQMEREWNKRRRAANAP